MLGGTPAYSPPDLFMSYGWDVWSSGVVLYLLLFGCFPFSKEERETGSYQFRLPRMVSNGALAFVFFEILLFSFFFCTLSHFPLSFLLFSFSVSLSMLRCVSQHLPASDASHKRTSSPPERLAVVFFCSSWDTGTRH